MPLNDEALIDAFRRVNQAFGRDTPMPTPKIDNDLGLTKTERFLAKIHNVFDKKSYSAKTKEPVIALEFENEIRSLERPGYEQDLILPESIGSFWMHQEGSLRYRGIEYVQQRPEVVSSTLESAKVLLESLQRNSKEHHCILTNSIRTSTHLHLDVTQNNIISVALISCLYWMLEEFLCEFCGDSRKGNLFCIRAKDSSYLQRALRNSLESRTFDESLTSTNYRYASLNLSALKKFGSLEFRLMRGTSSYDDVEIWVSSIAAIRDFALKNIGSLENLRDYFDKTPAGNIPKDIFGDALYKKLLRYSKLNSVEDSIRAGYMSVFPILSCRKSFTYEEEIKKEKEELVKKAEENERAKKERAKREEENRQRDDLNAIFANENENRFIINQAPPRVNRWEFPPMVIHDIYENPIEENGPMVLTVRGDLLDIDNDFVLESEVDI